MSVHYVKSFLQLVSMMNLFFVIFLLSLDLRVFCSKYSDFVEQYSKDARVEVYTVLDSSQCPKVIQPLCGTNGKEFLYFENKCHFEAKNYEQLIQGLMEYYQCPLSFCASACPKCRSVNKPVCAVQVVSGETKTFPNPCEVQRRICTTKQEWRIVNLFECNPRYKNNRISRPPNAFGHNYDCPELCTLEYQPICARFMTLEKEFENNCELRATICQTKQKWEIIRQGPCEASNYNTVTELYAIDSLCPIPCTLDYKPVCAKLHNKVKVFNNKCELENIRCQGHDWQIINEGPCWPSQHKLEHKECPEFCTNEYRPVCAEYKGQQREFGNSCKMLRAICDSNIAWKLIKMGTCFSYSVNALPDSHSCPRFCSNEYRPVCAVFDSKLQEFGNKCEMQKAICETNTNWHFLNKGHCPIVFSGSESLCPKICTKEFSPICVKFNGKLKEFPNSCELKKSICEINAEWELINRGPCVVKHIEKLGKSACENEILAPLCATFDFKTKTFNNLCQLAEEIKHTKNNWNILHKGICSNTTPASSRSASTSTIEASHNITTPSTTPTVTTSTTLKSTKYQRTTEQPAILLKTTTYITTNNPKTSTTPVVSTPAVRKTSACNANSEHSEEISNTSTDYSGEEGDDDSGSSSSIANCDKRTSFNYENKSEGDEYPDREDEQLKTPQGYETKSCVNNSSDEIDSGSASASEENSKEDYESDSKDNVASEKTSEEQSKYYGYKKLNDKNKKTEENEKYQIQNKTELNVSRSTIKKDRREEEEVENHKNIIPITQQNSGVIKKNGTDFQASNYLEGKSLTKWIKLQILELLNTMGNSQTSLENDSDCNKSENENTSFEAYQMPNAKSLENQITVSYSTTEETAAPDQEQDPSKYIQPKKGEIYNGVVYKAPFYDAPTYNFIYTAPFNFHGLGPHHKNNSLVNQTNSGAPANLPFDPYHFLSSLPATSGIFSKSNFMPVPTATDYGTKDDAYNHLSYSNDNQLKLPPSPFKLVNNNILHQTHPSLPLNPSPSHDNLLTYLTSLNNNTASNVPKSFSLSPNEGNKNKQRKEHHNNQPLRKTYKAVKGTLPSIRIKLPPSVTSEALSHPSAPLYHPPIPQQLPKSSEPVLLNRTNSPHISLNSTLLKQIVETLKIITNRYT